MTQVTVGRIGRAHGLRGELAVEVRTDDPERRFAVGSVLRTDPADRGPLVVHHVRSHHGRLLVEFGGVADRTAAEALQGTLLVADTATSAPTDDPDEFWDHELVGLQAVDPAGAGIGTVVDVVHGPAGDLLVLEHEGREVLVPFVTAIVPSVDPVAGRLVVAAPDGLLEL